MTTPAQTRRRALIALLDQYPIAPEAFLHDGRRAASPRDEFADKIEALFAEESSLFRDVMTASAAYVTRFGGELNPFGAEDKAEEEFVEFKDECDAIAFHLSFKRPHSDAHEQLIAQNRKDAAEELIDCLVTLGGMASCAGLTWEGIESAAREKLDKLNKRTTETHAWNGRTVERIGKKVKS